VKFQEFIIVAVLQDGAIKSDFVLKEKDKVTCGFGEEAQITLLKGDLPLDCFQIFRHAGKKIHLQLPLKSQGKIVRKGGRVEKVEDLFKIFPLKPGESFLALTLDEEFSRGKIHFGRTSVLIKRAFILEKEEVPSEKKKEPPAPKLEASPVPTLEPPLPPKPEIPPTLTPETPPPPKPEIPPALTLETPLPPKREIPPAQEKKSIAPVPLTTPAVSIIPSLLAMRNNFKSLDRFFGVNLGVGLLIQIVLMTVLFSKELPAPKETPLERLPDRFAKFIMEAPKQEVMEQEGLIPLETQRADENNIVRKEVKEKKPEKNQVASSGGGRSGGDGSGEGAGHTLTGEARTRQIEQKVAKTGMLALLTKHESTGGAAGGGTVWGKVQSLQQVSDNIDQRIRGAGGVRVAREAGDLIQRGGSGGGGEEVRAVGIDELKEAGGREVRSGNKVTKEVTSNLALENPEVTGYLDSDKISQVIKQKQSLIKACYEIGLRRNTGINGKVVVKFTINESGKVIEASIEESTLGDPIVEKCILRMIERLTFPPPEKGQVTVTYPFIFSVMGSG
jgi:TonB family protein